MKRIFSVIYGLLGAIMLLYGIAAVLFPAIITSDAAQSFPVRHILREQGAATIFIGLMSLWCALNYGRRAFVHYCLMVFAFLIAAIHWSDYLTGHLRNLSPIYNSVPFLVLTIMAVVGREKTVHKKPHPSI